MDSDMIVYESTESRARDSADTSRFDESISTLEKAGIHVIRMVCSTESHIPAGEASDLVHESGMSVLPVTTYQGAVIVSGAYPTDQDLADFLDVPDGVLSVDKMKAPAMPNDIMPACDCGNRNVCSRDRM